MATDYWEVTAWIDLATKSEEHYWYSITDSTEYKQLEKALQEELRKPNFSSGASDYMKSKSYLAYKTHIYNHQPYVPKFSFQRNQGMVDDIIQTKYTSAPSIKTFVEKTDNSDDERFAVYRWQRKVCFLMNKEK